MMLLFKESVRLKQTAPGTRKAALRDVLYGCIADYNKMVGNHRAPWLCFKDSTHDTLWII